MTSLPAEPKRPPGLGAIVVAFAIIGLESWGGGMSAWVRREVVVKRGWVEEQSFLAAYTLCQIMPGANVVNLATMLGTTLRGGPGACAALFGMVLPPCALILLFGLALDLLRHQPALGPIMAGLGAAAIGLTFANAIEMTRTGARAPWAAAVAAAMAIAIGFFRVPLLVALIIALPVSLALARREHRRRSGRS